MSLPPRGGKRPFLIRGFLGLVVLVLLVAALVAAAWYLRRPLLDLWVEPQLERVLTKRLGARVSLDRLTLEPGLLRLEGLVIERTGRFRLRLPAVECDWTLAALWRRHIDSVQIFGPELTLDQTRSEAHPPPSVVILKQQPWVLERLLVLDGGVALQRPDRSIRVSGLHLEFLADALPNLNLDLRIGDSSQIAVTAIGNITWDAEPDLVLTSLLVDERQLLATPLTLKMPLERPTADGEIIFGRIDRTLVERILAAFGQPDPLPPGIDFELQDLHLGLELTAAQTRLRLQARNGRFMQSGVVLPLTSLKTGLVENESGWQGEGEFLLAEVHPGFFRFRQDSEGITGEIQGTLAEVRSLPPLLTGAEPLPMAGGIDWKAQFSWRHDTVDLAGQLQGRRGENRPGDLLSLAPLKGTLELAGPPDRLRGKAEITFAGRRLLLLSGDGENFTWTLRPTALATLAGLAGRPDWAGTWAATGNLSGSGNLKRSGKGWQGRLKLAGDRWRGPGIDIVDPTVNGVLKIQEGPTEISELQLAAGLAGYGTTAPRITALGQVSWDGRTLEARLAEAGAAGIEYLAADGLAGLGGGEVTLRGEVSWIPDQGSARLNLEGGLRVGEILVGAYYGDLSGIAARWSLAASGNPAEGQLAVEGLTLELPEIGTLRGTGEIAPGSLHAQGTLNFPDLALAFGTHLQPLLAPVHPQMQELRLAGGLKMDFRGRRGPSGHLLEGVLAPAGLTIESPVAPFRLQDLTGEVPFVLDPSSRLPREEPREGQLSYARLEAGPLAGGPARLALTVVPNRLTFREPWRLGLAGGEVTVDGLQLGREPEGLLLEGRIRLVGVDLEELTRSLELTPMAGRIDADLGEFQYLAGLLQSEGEARIDAFGGTIRLRNLVARDPFSSYRSFSGDIDLTGIDLYQLTRTFEFGEMNGIIDGYVHDLRLFGTVPSAFVAEIRSRKEGKRNISVKALNNLTVVSQGGLTSALSRGLYRFIDFYRYSRIGFRCVLKNDVFVLRGTAREDSDRYLVSGSWLPPRIDILAPESTISFKQMLQRLKRIDLGGR